MLVIQGTPARINTSAGSMLDVFASPRYCVLVQAQEMPSSSPRESANTCYRSGAQMERSLTDRRAGRILISQFAAPPGRVMTPFRAGLGTDAGWTMAGDSAQMFVL